MKVVELDNSRDGAYRAFVAAHEQALVYHSLEYRNLLSKVTTGSARYLGCEDRSGALRGVLPMFQVEGAYGSVLNSLPYYGSHGGILADCPEARGALVAYYNMLVEQNGIAASTMVANPFSDDDLADVAHNCLDSRIGQMSRIDAESDHEDQLMRRYDTKTRNMIRKAEKVGVTVSSDLSSMKELQVIHEENMIALGGTAKTQTFFAAVAELFAPAGKCKVYTAVVEGKVAAALLVLFHGKVVEYFTPAVRKEYRSTQALSLIIYRAMIDASRKGFLWWNWGGTWSSQNSLHLFKSRWGTEERRYVYRTKVNNNALRSASAAELLREYPLTYVMPFSALKAD